MTPPPIAMRQTVRAGRFNVVRAQDLNAVFADGAQYYDTADSAATFAKLTR